MGLLQRPSARIRHVDFHLSMKLLHLFGSEFMCVCSSQYAEMIFYLEIFNILRSILIFVNKGPYRSEILKTLLLQF